MVRNATSQDLIGCPFSPWSNPLPSMREHYYEVLRTAKAGHPGVGRRTWLKLWCAPSCSRRLNRASRSDLPTILSLGPFVKFRAIGDNIKLLSTDFVAGRLDPRVIAFLLLPSFSLRTEKGEVGNVDIGTNGMNPTSLSGSARWLLSIEETRPYVIMYLKCTHMSIKD